jgi:hypothetical protein
VADPFCPNCGTEVDDDARFCPTCGRTLLVAETEDAGAPMTWDEPTAVVPRQEADPEAASEPIPPAPSWPTPEPEPVEPEGVEPAPAQQSFEPPPEPAAPASPAPAAPAPPPPTRSEPDLPFTWPVMLSGWLIGAGSGLAALTLLPVLGNPLNLLLFVALLAIAASVFLADRVPTIPHQRLATFSVVLVALGIALERAAFRVSGIDTIFLVMIVAAAAGALLLELGRDRPVPPPGGAS